MDSSAGGTVISLPEMKDEGIGRKLRLRRSIKALSLQDVAKLAGISVGLLSQIERGMTMPSIKSLRQICAALNMPVSWLFDTPDGDVDSIVIRAATRRVMTLGAKAMTKELLSPDVVPGIQMIRIVVQPGGSSGEPYNSGEGAKCGVVIAGKLGLYVDGREYILEIGDSFAFSAQKMHRFWCAGDQPLELIWVVAPAIY